jgi:streptogrisin C
LAREADAADLDRQIRSLGIASYAGGWFDSETWNLHVAISDARDRALIERLGATPVIVDHSLDRLSSAKAAARAAMMKDARFSAARKKVYIDFPSNKVIVGILPESAVAAENMFRSWGLDERILDVRPVDKMFEFAADVRGADGTENETWNQNFPADSHPCSIGASVVDGFAFAGHCGEQNDQIDTEDGSDTYGSVTNSTFSIVNGNWVFANNHDSAWVDTDATWTPKPKVNGYNDGIITVNSKWAGLQLAIVGATVCRYGQTSDGPHCGEVVTTDADGVNISGETIDDLIETKKACIEDGDSGGPLISGTDQIQGTLTGGSTNACPDTSSSNEAYFQRMRITLNEMSRIMLTSHGPNAPTIADLSCEGTGWSNFFCSTSYHAQGEPSISWDLNGSFFGTGTSISGTCVGDQWNSVDVDASNTYGTGSDSTTFYCYSGSPP